MDEKSTAFVLLLMQTLLAMSAEPVRPAVEADGTVHSPASWDGLDRCFFLDVELPESREAYAVIARFFDSHPGKSSSRRK